MELLQVDRILFFLRNSFLSLLVGALVLLSASSLDWRMEHDTPLLSYAAYLMENHQAFPYRDFFETSMPGTFAFHYLIGVLFGYSDLAFRLVDLALLAVLLSITFLFMARFGMAAATCSTALFGLLYLSHGQEMSLQRDYLGTIPVAFAMLLVPAGTGSGISRWKFVFAGALLGLAFLVKPHLIVAFPLFFGALLAFKPSGRAVSFRGAASCLALMVASFSLPIAAAIAWLAANSALLPFARVFFQYLPLHTALTGGHVTIAGSYRAEYLVFETFRFGGYAGLLVGALFACYRYLGGPKLTRPHLVSSLLLLLLVLAYSVYPTFSGKFWPYHYMPFIYFSSIAIGLGLGDWPRLPDAQMRWRVRESLLLVSVFVALVIHAYSAEAMTRAYGYLRNYRISYAPKNGRVDEIAAWLIANLREGDRVQPLDWTGGSIHAMLIAKANLATKFMYDYHFYHHVSLPLIQSLRAEFIGQLSAVRPRFIIEVDTEKPWVSGHDTTREFPDLRKFLDAYYRAAHEGRGFRILERLD